MCLSSIFEIAPDSPPKQVGSKVSNIHIDGNKISFTNIMGDETILYGTVEDIDLLDNKIFVRVEE